MIHVILGTKAQLIKMAPIMRLLQDRGVEYRFIATGQHRETMQDLLDNFGIRRPDVVLYDGPDVTSIPRMALWSLRILASTAWRRAAIFGPRPAGMVLVHGDTFSTLLGALMGRMAGLRVGHVESGLRSFRLLHPFPEELTRLAVFRLAQVHYCAGAWALANLRGVRGEKIDTGGNTLADSVRLAAAAPMELAEQSFAQRGGSDGYCVASIHRFENIRNRAALERIVALLERIAANRSMVFVLHPPTLRKLRRHRLLQRLELNPRIELRPRSDFFRFIRLVGGADFVVSDGGSNQEECYYLGKPVLLLRMATERREGLGENCVLSRYDPQVVDRFVEQWQSHRRPLDLGQDSPSRIIVEHCLAAA